jgi:hypothetical protein
MIWHIFRKDWKLLWWKVLIVEALLVAGVIMQTAGGHFGPAKKAPIGLLIVGFAAALVLMTELVQLDPLAGAGQDWVARPVSRMELLLAKVLFVLLTLALPMLLTEMGQDLAVGVPFGKALWGATFDTVSGVLSIGLPALAFAALFRNLTQTIAASFIAILALFTVGFAIQGNVRFPLAGTATGSGIQWMFDLTGSVFYFAGALFIFAIQYSRRRTILARWVTAGVFLLVCFTPLLPWDAAFAVEQSLSPVAGAGANAKIIFHPPSAPVHTYSPLAECVPIAVSGVASDSWLNIDGVQVSLLGEGDRVLWSDRMSEQSVTDSTPVLDQLRGDLSPASNGRCQLMGIPQGIVNKVWNQPRRVRLDYSLTLFAQDKTYAMPAWNGDQRMPGIGWCRTRVGQTLELGCVSDDKPMCLEAGVPRGPGDPDPAYSCKPDYDAMRGGPDVTPWQVTLSFAARPGDKLVLRTYKPLDHFTRQMTTREIMPDWHTTKN